MPVELRPQGAISPTETLHLPEAVAPRKSLYGLTSEYAQLEALIESAYETTMPPAPPKNASDAEKAAYQAECDEIAAQRVAVDEALAQMLADNDIEGRVKVDSYCRMLKEHEALAKWRSDEAARLDELAKGGETLIKRMKAALLQYMDVTKQDSLATLRFKVAVTANGGTLPLLLDPGLDPEMLDKRWQRVTTTVDTDAVRKALEVGSKLSFAYLGERGKHVRIR